MLGKGGGTFITRDGALRATITKHSGNENWKNMNYFKIKTLGDSATLNFQSTLFRSDFEISLTECQRTSKFSVSIDINVPNVSKVVTLLF
jgi:hypothetical protein